MTEVRASQKNESKSVQNCVREGWETAVDSNYFEQNPCGLLFGIEIKLLILTPLLL